MLRVIVAFGREDHEHGRYRKQGKSAADARVKLTVKQTVFSLAVDTITAVGTAAVLALGAHKALNGGITPGQLLVVMGYVAMVYKPLETISSTYGGLQEVFASLKISFDLLDTVPDIKDAVGATNSSLNGISRSRMRLIRCEARMATRFAVRWSQPARFLRTPPALRARIRNVA